MKVELENVKPMEIEARSFEIITQELGDTPLIPGTEPVVKRCIHTSADFDYARNLCFSRILVRLMLWCQAPQRKYRNHRQMSQGRDIHTLSRAYIPLGDLD